MHLVLTGLHGMLPELSRPQQYLPLPQVSRFSSFYIVNNLVPIVLSTSLGFFVFLLDVDEMVRDFLTMAVCPCWLPSAPKRPAHEQC